MKFYSNFLSQWFFISFCLFFIFNLYVWGFILQRIYFAPSSKFPVAVQWAIFFCHLFSFYREYIFFCRGNISFAITYIFFTMSIFLFPQWTFSCCKISVSLQDFFFWRDLFLSRCKNFSFAASFLLVPWAISFLPEVVFYCHWDFSFAGSLFLLQWDL